jgi:hypothetical protein
MKKALILSALLLTTLWVQAQTPNSYGTPGTVRTSVQIGDWTTPATWDCNCVPASDEIANIVTDSVIISTHVYIRELRSTTGGKLHMTTTAWLEYTAAFQNLNTPYLKPKETLIPYVFEE